MTLNTQAKKEFSAYQGLAENFELSMKVLSWAHLNFQLQSFLFHKTEAASVSMKSLLDKVGYTGEDINSLSAKQFNSLFENESFFSASQTGKRIAAYTLKENGLNKDRFASLEESITNAYNDVKKEQFEHGLLSKSYQHCINTLAVFKP